VQCLGLEGAQDTINALTAMIQESKEKAKAIEDDKDKHNASTDPGVDYSTTFRDSEKESDLIPSGQGERLETFPRIPELMLQNRHQLTLDTMATLPEPRIHPSRRPARALRRRSRIHV